MKKYEFGKRAQLGATLTWIAAFIIILFVMALFLLLTASLIGEKKIPVISSISGSSKDKIELASSLSSSLNVQKDLHSFLDIDIDYKGSRVKASDLLAVSHKDFYEKDIELTELERNPDYESFNVFRENLISHFNGIYDSCYSACVYFVSGESYPYQEIFGNGCSGEEVRSSLNEIIYSCEDLFDDSEESSYPSAYVVSANGEIKIKLFRGGA